MSMLETMATSTNERIKDHGRKMWVDRGKASNLQGLKGNPILYVTGQNLLTAQNCRLTKEARPGALTGPEPEEQNVNLCQIVLPHNDDRANQPEVHLINSTANDALVRQEAVVLVDFNNPAAVAPALAGEAGAGHDEGKRKKNEEN